MKILIPSYAGENRVSKSVKDNNKKPPMIHSKIQ